MKRHTEAPTRLYDPTPVIVQPSQVLSPADGYQPPQIVVMQMPQPERSWLKAHAGELIAATGLGAIAVTMLLAVAVVAIAVGIGALSIAFSFLILKSVMASQTKK